MMRHTVYFYSSNFKNLIREDKDRILYEGLRMQPQSALVVETFLIASHHKKKVEVTFEETEKSFYGVQEQQKEQLEIQKPQWGAVRIHVSSDADFLIPGKQIITENDFIGSTCFYEYYIDADAMHAGKNFGRLCFELPDQSFYIPLPLPVRRERKSGRFLNIGKPDRRGQNLCSYILITG